MSLQERYQELLNSLASAKPTIVAVTKYATDEQLLEAYRLGIRDFAENYVLAALERKQRMSGSLPEVRWHLSGHLQKNKVNKAVGAFDLIQTIDSLELAQLVSRRAESLGIKQAVLIQVKFSDESKKTGYLPEDLVQEFATLIELQAISIQGLMTMAAKETKQSFAKLAAIKTQLEQEHNYPLKQLSMGMSQDYLEAIQAGSTMIRIGTKFFA